MGKKWDDLTGSGGFTKPGIGDRKTEWPSFGADTTNASCRECGGRMRGSKRCGCEEPDWHVKGEDYDPDTKVKARNALQQEWHLQWLTEAYRVLEPGGVIKAFSGTRTYHRLAAAMEEAGFTDIRLEAWTYGSGFPKSLNVSKAIDKHFGKTEEREIVGTSRGVSVEDDQGYGGIARGGVGIEQKGVDLDVTVGATEEARQYEGWGTALKPSWEPVVVGRKP